MAKKKSTKAKAKVKVTSRKSDSVPNGRLITTTKGKRMVVKLQDGRGKVRGSAKNF